MNRQPNTALRRILYLDAATCAVMGGALLLAAGLVSSLTAIPRDLLFYAGAALLPIAAFMAATGARGAGDALMVWTVILGNAGWAAASLALLAGIISPNLLGVAFIGVQALIVAILAYAEFAAWTGRRGNAVA